MQIAAVTSTREVLSLDGIWRFALAVEELAEPLAWIKPLPQRRARDIPVPASYNDIFIEKEIHDHVGWALYQQEVRVPRGWQQERYFVRLDAATHEARVFINDHLATTHVGGYTPFEVEITAYVRAGEKFCLTDAVNNELTNETIPPGKIEVSSLNAKRRQTYNHDFFNYAGLSRSVWLYSVPPSYIEDVTLVTGVNGTTGTIQYGAKTNGEIGSSRINVVVRDEEGHVITEAEGLKRCVTVNIRASSGTLTDEYTVLAGIRTVEVRGNQFLINSKPFYFTGFGMHEDHLVRGKGHDAVSMVYDFELLAWTGASSFRTSHYPYAEEVMDFADRHGIVVIDETAAVGLNLAMVSGILELTKELDPSSRPVTFANESSSTYETDQIADLVDFLCLNRYYGWYRETGDLKTAEVLFEEELCYLSLLRSMAPIR
ncbi:beta-galactosidase, putative [Talaromyces stipitatus ATCC 10500]|uniref:Beta-galactosidase, putative n=1 Tax=Talaromyces stipitatus (strain ATCC 10500 / CBS 375.48 / QM 6759 / NRRL 1006) TaxID=441959 RepID=B8LVN3_TALSN|nr:beta-galactosidase, putative [Talaromyces stipitatus ATCC 10500]EED24163.1 beta-galactosidase, putative [Talaromyces stipitatus ATCC 10500]